MKTFIRPLEDWIAIAIVGLVALGIVLACEPAHAEISEQDAVRAIIGEALPDYNSMYAIACAIRNRDKSGIGLRGVYGLHAKHAQDPSGELWQRASRAWYESEHGVDVVKGSDHWLSDYDLKFSKPSLIKFRFNMIETAYIGQTHFLKEVSK